jgi:hypothetical protein
MTIKKEPDDNIYCHQAPGYTAKIVKTIPYSIHIEKNNQEQYKGDKTKCDKLSYSA